MPRLRVVWQLGLVALATTRIAFAQPTPAQQSPAPAPGGTISGVVIDATTGEPLARSAVTLSVADGFGVLSGARTGSSSYALAHTVTTSAAGVYRFADLPIGAYRVYVQRVGYAPATLVVELGETGTSPLSIGLVVAPVRLRAIRVRATGSGLLATDGPGRMTEDDRVLVAREREREFLSTDARELTSADVAESATLGGNDVLRALQRLPGVTQLDDWSAKLWVRGNRWDHNRVYYDGLPLFDPLQALGRGSGLSADAIGGAFIHPGVRPVSVGGEGATQIDLRSRAPGGAGAWRGSAELSQFGAGASLERERKDESAGFTLSAHHTLGDWLPPSSQPFGAFDRAVSHAQVAGRGEIDLGSGRRMETSGLFTRDSRRYAAPVGVSRSRQNWENAVGRATFRAPLGSFAMSHTLGISHFASNSARWFVELGADTLRPPAHATVSFVSSTVDYVTLGGRLESPPGTRDQVRTGYDLIVQRSSLGGPRQGVYWGDVTAEHTSRNDALAYASIWSDRRLELGERVAIEGGLRLDVGGSSRLGAVRPAPSAQARFSASSNTWLSIGASRTHQYVQGIDPPIVAHGETVPGLWLTSGGDVPMMSIDNVMAGVEHWMGAGVLIAGNAYARRTSGAITGDPAPGALIDRPLFVTATESARGVEVSARKLVGRATGLVAYSYGKATTDASHLSYASPADRTHALDAAGMVRVGSVRLGGAFTFTSGAPYTRVASGPVFLREAPNARRLPSYQSLDLSIDYTRTIGRASLTGFAGLQNALGRKNPTWYQFSGVCPGESQASDSERCSAQDAIEAPVKFAPTIGLRLLF